MSGDCKGDGGPAFPQNLPDDFVWRLPGSPGGMSLRDYFAAKALSGLLADPNVAYGNEKTVRLCNGCYLIADAMLEARRQ
jgi:hypothetical protein